MIKEIRKIANNNLDLNNLKEYNLSIQLSLDGFSFCIYNSNPNEVLALAVYEFQSNTIINPVKHLELVTQLYKQEELLKPTYKSVFVSHFNNLVSQVPLALFNKNNLQSYLQYSIKLLENDYITFDEINSSEIVNIYVPFVNINNFLIDKYGAFMFKHSSTILIENLLKSCKNSEGLYLFINVINSNFELVVINNNKLELFNCFSFKTKEDFIYYILFIAEQLQLNPEEFKLVLMGDIEKESELYSIAYQYIRNISFYTPIDFPSNISNEVSKHACFTLLSQL